jgi:hypothetical protein
MSTKEFIIGIRNYLIDILKVRLATIKYPLKGTINKLNKNNLLLNV